MVKQPKFGKVKTRLAKDIGSAKAAWWFRHQANQLMRQVGGDVRWNTVLSVAPYTAIYERDPWPNHLDRIPQAQGDLGDRMLAVFNQFRQGSTVIIGADIPSITRNDIAKSFQALGSNHAVFGPATDGGYWLVGMKGGPSLTSQNLFKHVRWSTKYALEDTIANLKGQKIKILRMMQDIDEVDDLRNYPKKPRMYE